MGVRVISSALVASGVVFNEGQFTFGAKSDDFVHYIFAITVDLSIT